MKSFFVLASVLVTGILSVIVLHSNLGGAYLVNQGYGQLPYISGDYGSSKGHTYFYETGTSGITGPPDFIVTKGLGSVPICFDTYFDKGGFRTDATPSVTKDYVSCFVIQPEDLFASDRGSLPVHCFLRTRYVWPIGALPHPAVCALEGKPIRYQDEDDTVAIRDSMSRTFRPSEESQEHLEEAKQVAQESMVAPDIVSPGQWLRVGQVLSEERLVFEDIAVVQDG